MHELDREDFDGGGFFLSGLLDIQFSRNWGILLWLDFINGLSGESTFDVYTQKYKLSYLSIAPMAKYCISGSNFFLMSGFGLGIKTKAHYSNNYDYSDFDIEELNPRLDFRFGAGYDFFIKEKYTITPMLSYQAGLTNVIRDTKWKVHALQIGVAFRYLLN